MQSIATVIALLLVNQTKYSALWICCIIGLSMLTVERVLQLMTFGGHEISDLTLAWVGIIVSLSFSIGVVCARFLVRHVDLVTLHRRLLENRLMTAVLRTEERSRASFSRELHDGLGPLLSSAKMSLSALSRADIKDKDRVILQNTAAVIDEAIRSLREISNNLSPHVLNNFGLIRGIKHFVERIAAIHDTKIVFRRKYRGDTLPRGVRAYQQLAQTLAVHTYIYRATPRKRRPTPRLSRRRPRLLASRGDGVRHGPVEHKVAHIFAQRHI